MKKTEKEILKKIVDRVDGIKQCKKCFYVYCPEEDGKNCPRCKVTPHCRTCKCKGKIRKKKAAQK